MDPNNQIIVETAAGRLAGRREGTLCVFRGIPYAAPPVGERRWAPPEACPPWPGVRDASRFGPAAPQVSQAGAALPGHDAPPEQDEDCLFLNIWTPGPDDRRRPVMVWIHGGGFTAGAGSQPVYAGDRLAERGDIVYVSINFRLGLLGHLNLNEATGGAVASTGNEGLLDQLAALAWVRDNIAHFGGDPDNVTVFGESSGAMSIGCLLAMPAARGLFHRAILQSGTGRMARPLDISVSVARHFLELTGLKRDDAAGLRSLPVARLLEIQQELAATAPGNITPVAPVIDGQTLPGVPNEVAKAGAAMKIPIIVGNNRDEFNIALLRQPQLRDMDEAALTGLVQGLVPENLAAALIDAYRAIRTGRGQPASPADLFSAIRTDVMFRLPAVELARAYGEHGLPAFNYLFAQESPAAGGTIGACHAMEIGFVFGRLDPEFCGTGPAAEQLADRMQETWIAFARTGNPGGAGLGDWPPYWPGRATLVLGPESRVERSVFEEERLVWQGIDQRGTIV